LSFKAIALLWGSKAKERIGPPTRRTSLSIENSKRYAIVDHVFGGRKEYEKGTKREDASLSNVDDRTEGSDVGWVFHQKRREVYSHLAEDHTCRYPEEGKRKKEDCDL